MRHVFKIFFSVLLLFSYISIKAQKEQYVNLSNFYLFPNNKEVEMYWVIDSGSTCNGITIWHSTDSLNYIEIGYIGGVCGSNSTSISYNFTHRSPQLNKLNYYKLKLGYVQFSEVEKITIKYTEPGKLYVYPNPSNSQTTIEFNNSHNKPYQLTIINSVGNLIYKKEDIIESEVSINTSTWNPGTYYITLSDDTGHILKEKLIIAK